MRSRATVFLAWMISPSVLLAANAIDIDREARTQEAQQHSIATTTDGLAKEIGELADEMGYNGIASPDEIKALHAIAKELSKLTDSNTDKMMPYVQAQLAAARGTQAKDKLGNASAAQTTLVDVLEKLAIKLQKKAASSAAAALRDALKKQEGLKKDTEKLADQTVGKKAEELSPTEKSEAKRLADRQQEVAQAIKQATDQLKAEAKQAADQGNKDEAKKLDQAAKNLEKAKASDEAKQASSDVASNQLNRAQDEQDKVIAALTQAEKDTGQSDASNQPQDPQSKLQDQIDRLSKIEAKQQQNLDAAKNLPKDGSQAQQNQIQSAQSDIANDIKQEAQQAPSPSLDQAAKSADQAQQQLGKNEQTPAKQSMQKVLDALSKAKADLQKQLDAMQAADQAAQMAALANQEQALMDQAQQAGSQAQMQALAQQQQAIQQALQQAPMQNAAVQQAQQAAGQAAQALQAGQQSQAMAAMAQALAAMQQASQQPGNPNAPPPPAITSKGPKPADGSSNGATGKGSAKNGAWNVSLEPSERETLSRSTGEKFPDRYEQQLTDYYRALAGKEAK